MYTSLKISPKGKSTLVSLFAHLLPTLPNTPPPNHPPFSVFEGMWHISPVVSVREGQLSDMLSVVVM